MLISILKGIKIDLITWLNEFVMLEESPNKRSCGRAVRLLTFGVFVKLTESLKIGKIILVLFLKSLLVGVFTKIWKQGQILDQLNPAALYFIFLAKA